MERLERELDGRLDIHFTGGLMVAETEDQLRLLHEKRVIEEEAGLDIEVLEGEELRTLRSVPRRRPRSAPRSAPRRGTPTRRSRRRSSRFAPSQAGAVIRTHAEVTGIEVDDNGGSHRFTVTTAAGRIRAQRLVNAAGAWANELAALTGFQLPSAFGRAASQRHRAA